jgi:hypothetical protein
MRSFLVITGVVVLLVMSGVIGEAQSDTLVVSMLPDAEAIGDGWAALGEVEIDLASEEFGHMGSAAQTYIGPEGARVRMRVVAVSPGMVSADRAIDGYEDLVSEFRRMTQDASGISNDYEIQRLPNARGCDQTLRAAGYSPFDLFPFGATVCVTGVNAIVYVTVSGSLTDPGSGEPLMFFHASDHLAELVAQGIAELPEGASLTVPDHLPGSSPEASPTP